MRCKNLVLSALLGVLLTLVGFAAGGQEIIGTLTNFDVFNWYQCPVDDFVVCFYDMILPPHIGPWCIESWYPGWGSPPTITPNAEGFCVRWLDCDHAVLPSDVVHFGLRLAPNCLAYMLDVGVCVRAFWTIGGVRVHEVPLPMQSWLSQDGVVIDLIQYCNDDVGPVTINRGFATLKDNVPLERLMWDELNSILREHGRQWEFLDEELILYPRETIAELRIPVEEGDRAVLVWYTVSVNGKVVTRVINEAILAECW